MIGDVSCIRTPQHTGTWFVLDFLKAHSMVRVVIQKEMRLRGVKRSVEMCKRIRKRFHLILHQHRYGVEANKADDTNLYRYTRFRIKKSIYTVRDPLKAAITRQVRHPDLYPHTDNMEAFNVLSQMKGEFFFAIDLKRTPEEKYKALCDVLAYLNLPIEPYVQVYAEAWKPVNTVEDMFPDDNPRRHLRNLYEAGEYWEVFEAMRDPILQLRAMPHLRGFLERLGYKSLPWW